MMQPSKRCCGQAKEVRTPLTATHVLIADNIFMVAAYGLCSCKMSFA